MPNVDDFYPSKYLKADDLGGKDHTLTISRWDTELMENRQNGTKENKPIIYFEGKQKGLILNKTNASSISSIHGKEMAQWPGKQITIGGVWVESFGETVLAIRVRPQVPQYNQAPPVQPAPNNTLPADTTEQMSRTDLDDEIPF